MHQLKYLSHYNEATKQQVKALIEKNRLEAHLVSKYKNAHAIKTDKALFDYVNKLKNEHMKKSAPLSKVAYDGKIHVIDNALGMHSFISRVQGNKLKSKNEIRVASLFKTVPEEFLQMIVVHELAHFKEKEHNKAFYSLCSYMQKDYHQLEFNLRLYLTCRDISGAIEAWI